MSWLRTYRLALRLLPAPLRHKHGAAMEALFASEQARASARGIAYVALAGAAGVWDVIRRSGYERVRPRPDVDIEDAHTPLPTAAQLVRRLAPSFAFAFACFTTAFVANFAWRQVPLLTARGLPAHTIVEAVLLAVPFTAALTIPMSVFVCVLSAFSRLRTDGTLAAARTRRGGTRRLVAPALAAAALIGGVALAEITVVLPPANARLAAIVMEKGAAPSERAMTLNELRDAERATRHGTKRVERRAAAVYEVEIQKKFALPAACLALALAGIAFALHVPRMNAGVTIAVSCVVFAAYYLAFITGESLAVGLVIPPAVGMWGANAVLCALALLALSSRRTTLMPRRS